MNKQEIKFPCILLRAGGWDVNGMEVYTKSIACLQNEADLIQTARRFWRFLEPGERPGFPSPRTVEAALRFLKWGAWVEIVDDKEKFDRILALHLQPEGPGIPVQLDESMRLFEACGEDYGWKDYPSRVKSAEEAEQDG